MIVYWLQIHIPTYMDLTKSYKAKLKAAKLIYFKESKIKAKERQQHLNCKRPKATFKGSKPRAW